MSDPNNQRRRRRGVSMPSPAAVASQVVTTAVVAYGAYRLVDWAYHTWWKSPDNNNSSSDNNETDNYNNNEAMPSRQGQYESSVDRRARGTTAARRRRERQQRLRRCQRECGQAWQALGSATSLSPLIVQATDTVEATNRLKDIRSLVPLTDELNKEQIQLWHHVKIKSFTRLVATAYAQSLLILVLTVQVNLWGAQLWQEQQQQQAPANSSVPSLGTNSVERMQSYQQEHQQVLQRTFAYFFASGVAGLTDCVAKATESVLADWDVFERMYLDVSRGQVIEALGQIRSVVEELGAKRRRSLWRFFVPPENYFETSNVPVAIDTTSQDNHLSDILAETWDWVESPLLQDALQDTLGVTFDFCQEECLPWHSVDDATTYSLAKLLPKITKSAMKLQARPDHPLIQRIQQLSSVQEIGNLCFR